jgi:glutathione S-transferase
LLEIKSDEVYLPHIKRLMGLQERPEDPAAIAARATAARFYADMDAQLTGRNHLAGDYSFADIAFYMAQLFGERMGAPVPADATHLLAWRARMSERPAVRKVVRPMADYLVSQGRRLPAFMAAVAAA